MGPSATVAEAATLMGKQHVGSALVMDDERVVGMFTERDIVERWRRTSTPPATR